MNVIITGASRGIGYQTALLLSNLGHHVMAVSRNTENLKKLKAESQSKNSTGSLFTYAADVSDEKAMDKLFEEIKLRFNQVNVLVNNAGILINKPFSELTLNDWNIVYATNVFGAVNITRSLLPLMTPGSHVVNISSMGGFQGSVKFKGLSAYSSSKAALVNITECLAEELKDRKIAVNCLCLGSVQTEMFSAAFPLVHAALSEAEMAHYVAQFATEGHLFFNGKIIPVSNSTP